MKILPIDNNKVVLPTICPNCNLDLICRDYEFVYHYYCTDCMFSWYEDINSSFVCYFNSCITATYKNNKSIIDFQDEDLNIKTICTYDGYILLEDYEIDDLMKSFIFL